MTIPNISHVPRVWDEHELREQSAIALEEFVERRLAEPGGKYVSHIRKQRTALRQLFQSLAPIDPEKPDPEAVRAILLQDEMFDALRYVSGPPVSEDDLGVLVTRSIKGITKRDLRSSDELPIKVLKLICQLADPYRFPWVAGLREPTWGEIRNAIGSTMVLHATQALQTERRGHGKIVEHRLQDRLIELGFDKIKAPNGAKIVTPSHYPEYPKFYGECTVYKRKVDLFIALPDKRMVAVEAKDSSSSVNSVKRILNDTAAKAKAFGVEAGKNIITVALLSGVFRVENLLIAQADGLYLVWAHDLDGFVDWIKSQT